MKTVVNMLFIIAPEAAVLMPNERLLLCGLDAAIRENVAYSRNSIKLRTDVAKTELLGQSKNFLPDSLRKLGHFLLRVVNIFNTNASMLSHCI